MRKRDNKKKENGISIRIIKKIERKRIKVKVGRKLKRKEEEEERDLGES